jgi:uncharacterized protein YprB with RNaseH-like and TPR domain
MANKIEVIFDIETKNSFDDENVKSLADWRISIVSVYRREIDENHKEVVGEMKSFWTEDARGKVPEGELFIPDMWKWFEGADRIIGFNSLGFDAPIVNEVYEGDFLKLPHFDVLEIVRQVFGHRIKLDYIAKETIGMSKFANGLDAIKWWAAGDPDSLANLKKYCEIDVEVTKKVYDHGLQHGKLRFKDKWNELREIEVDFSYPVAVEKKEEEQVTQLGLF